MDKKIFTYIRRDGYIERITAEQCNLILNGPPTAKGNLPKLSFDAEHIKSYSIWDEYDVFGNLTNVKEGQRRVVCNYHVIGIPHYKRVFRGDLQVTETERCFHELRASWLEIGAIELMCDESDSLELVVSYARDKVEIPRLQKEAGQMFSNVAGLFSAGD